MSRIYDRAFRFYIESVSGHLSPEDKDLLDKELAADGAFREIWVELEKEGSDLKEFLDGTDPGAELELLKQRVRMPVGIPGNALVGGAVGTSAISPASVRVASHVQPSSDVPVRPSDEVPGVTPADVPDLAPVDAGIHPSAEVAFHPSAEVAVHPPVDIPISPSAEVAVLTSAKLPRRSPALIRKIFFAKRSIAAAVLLLLAGTGYYIFLSNAKITNKDKIASIVSHNRQAISLTLNNGKSITLFKDSVRQTIVSDNATLTSGDGTLKYRSEDTAQNTLFIPAGQDYKIVLSDGTEVMLNAATKLRFPFNFSGRSRVVWLEGEAYFKVAKDAKRPFIVQTPLTQIQVLGTSFNVNTYTAGNVTTSLVEGKVTTHGSTDDKEIELKPGYAASFQEARGFSLNKFDEEDVLSWMSGTYYFHNIPVDKLTDLIYRCYGVVIVLDKEKLAQKSVTGLMDRKKLTEFLSDLETTAQIKYYYSGNQLRLE